MPIIPATLDWLPVDPHWRVKLKQLQCCDVDDSSTWERAVALARSRLDYTTTNALDQVTRSLYPRGPTFDLPGKPVKLAVLGSSTTGHLLPAIRVAGLRREIWIDTYEPSYGQYLQELLDTSSGLYQFEPTALLFAMDARHITQGLIVGAGRETADSVRAGFEPRLQECWGIAQRAFGCPLLQQSALNVFPGLLGENEHRLAGSGAAAIERFNAWLREQCDRSGVDLVSVDRRAARDGLSAWYNAALWHRAKQEVAPIAAPMYGDMVGRVLAARQGRSFKCLVLDLDNTLWGGVIGDDGIEGIQLGHGTAVGEAFAEVQQFARDLAGRGVILAVNSKNDEATALEVFERHPDMLLRRSEIACFVANWQDKAANLRHIAERLNIGLDAIVFVDDNPAERALVRHTLPMVAVPELPDDPALVPAMLADAGYFESATVTDEDRERSRQYHANSQRESLRSLATDMPSYLRSLQMRLIWRRFDAVGLPRVVQLINKTNQFNLTTRRYTDDDVKAVLADPLAVGLQLRLVDRFGDNGIIAVVIGRLDAAHDLLIDTWLMSCRVLGRQVEQATLALLAQAASAMGARRLVGEYIPSTKNGMVKDHYPKLGFAALATSDGDSGRYALDLAGYQAHETCIAVSEGE